VSEENQKILSFATVTCFAMIVYVCMKRTARTTLKYEGLWNI